jgi:hypothetical protein
LPESITAVKTADLLQPAKQKVYAVKRSVSNIALLAESLIVVRFVQDTNPCFALIFRDRPTFAILVHSVGNARAIELTTLLSKPTPQQRDDIQNPE